MWCELDELLLLLLLLLLLMMMITVMPICLVFCSVHSRK